MILGFGKYEGKGGVLLCEKIKTKPKPKTKTKPFEKDKILTLLSRAFSENTNEIYTYQACFWKDNMILGFGRYEGREGVLLGKAGVSVPESIRLREDINRKKTSSFGHCANEGGRVYQCPDFWPLFLPSISP